MSGASEGSQDPLASGMAGRAMTVRGLVDPAQLGVTLMHEHLFIDVSKTFRPDEDAPVTEMALWEQKLTLENLHFARERRAIADNWVLADEETAIKEALEYRDRGGGTIVDVTSIGIHRDPLALLKVSMATGLNVVMGAGWYQKLYHPADMDERTVEDLAEEIVRDIRVGVRGTGVHSGIIGEVGIEGDPMTPNEVKSIRASARASRVTGGAISFHAGGRGREKFAVIGILGEEGADLSRVVFGHSDSLSVDMDFMLELLEHGVYIQFDLLGKLGVPLSMLPSSGDRSPAASTARTAAVAEAIPKLIEAGYVERMLISQDLCSKAQLKAYGGTGYSFILEKFLPHLRSHGVAEEQIQTIMVENPKRVLTFVEPKTV